MKVFQPFAFLFALQQQQQQQNNGANRMSASTGPLFLFQSAERTTIDTKVQDLLTMAAEVGQVGSIATEEDQKRMEVLASELEKDSISNPARYPLEGVHDLIYSAAPGGSSGKVGMFVGKVQQTFEDDGIFYNSVELGPLKIALKARREVKNGTKIKVSFLESIVSIFGQTVVQKEIGGGGVWNVKFVRKVQDSEGNQKLLRIMETPSLFVIEQKL